MANIYWALDLYKVLYYAYNIDSFINPHNPRCRYRHDFYFMDKKKTEVGYVFKVTQNSSILTHSLYT